MPRRDEGLLRQLIQMLVQSGGELTAVKDLGLELAMALGTTTEAVNDALVYLRRQQVLILDRDRSGVYFGAYILPTWEQAATKIHPELVEALQASAAAEVEATEEAVGGGDTIDYATLAQHLLEAAGKAIEQSRGATELQTRLAEAELELDRIHAEMASLKDQNEQLRQERDELHVQFSSRGGDDTLVAALQSGFEAAKQEVKRLRNEVVAAQNEIRSLDMANKSLRRELNKTKARVRGVSVWEHLKDEDKQELARFRRELEEGE